MENNPPRNFLNRLDHGPLKIAGLYILIGSIWIVISDRLADEISPNQYTFWVISVVKGWVYVFITGLLLYWLIKRHINSLQEAEKRLVHTFSRTMMSIWELDLQTNNILWSPALFDMASINREELAGSRTSFNDLIHPEDFAGVMDSARKAMKDKTLFAAEFRVIRPDGEVRWLSNMGRPEIDPANNRLYMVGTVQDITEQRQAEQALRESEKKFRLLTENSVFGVYIIQDAKMAYVNPSAAEAFGYLPEEIIGRLGPNDLIHPDDIQVVMSRLQERIEGKTESEKFVYKAIKKDGSIINIEIYGMAIDYQGNPAVMGTLMDVTERKKAEEALRASETRFRVIFEKANDAIHIENANDEILEVNSRMCELMGYSREELLKMHVADLQAPEIRKPGNVIKNELARHGSAVFEAMNLHRDGRRIPVEVSIGCIELPAEDLYVSVVRDISEHKQAEQALREGEQRYRSLFEGTPVAIWEEDFSEVKKYLDSLKKMGITDFHAYFASHPEAIRKCDSLIRILDVNNTAVKMYRADGKQELIESTNQFGSKQELEQIRSVLIAIAEGRNRDCWEGADATVNGEPIEISLSWSIVPGHEQDYSRAIVTTMDVTERKKANEELQARDALLRAVQKIARLGHYRLDIASGIWESSEVLDEVFGIDMSYPTNVRGWADLIHPDQRDEMVAYFADHVLKEQHPFDREYRIIRNNDSQERWVHGLGLLQFDARGNPIQMIGTIQDITERKLAEQKYQEIFENSVDGIFQSSPEGRYLNVNPAFARIYGYDSPREMIESVTDIANQIYADPVEREEFSRLLQTRGVVENFERKNRRKDGSIIWTSTSARAVRDGGGSILYYEGFLQNITDRKQVEDALQQAETKYRALFENAIEGIFQTTPAGKLFTANPALAQMLGYDSPAELIASVNNPGHEFYVQPGRREEFVKQLSNHGMISNFESEVHCKDGSTVWISENGQAVYDDSGQVLYYEGTMANVTERRQAEERLRASEERFSQMAEHIQEAFWMTDVENDREIYLSPATEMIWGRPIEELMETTASFLERVLPQDREAVALVLAKQKTGEKTEMEYRVQRPDGSIRWVWDRAFPILDESGKVKILTGIAADVTERKQAEQQMQTLFEAIPDGVVVVDAEGNIIVANAQIEALFWYRREELLGQPIEMLLPGRVRADHPRHRDGYLAAPTTRAMGSGHELYARRKDGSEFPVDINLSTMETEHGRTAISVIRDITARTQARDALRESESRYRSLFENSPISLWEEDFSAVKARLDALHREGVADFREYFRTHPDVVAECAGLVKVLDINQATLALFKAKEKVDLINNLGKLLSNEPSYQFENELINIAEGKTKYKSELVNLTLEGDAVNVDLSWSVAPGHEDDLSKVIVTIIDITERKRAEEALNRRAEELAGLQATVLEITASHDLPGLLHTIVERAAHLLQADGGGLYLCDPERQEARCVVSYNTIRDYTGTVLKYGEGAAGLIAQTGEPLIIDDYRTWSGGAGIYKDDQPFQMLLSVPMPWQGQVIGVLHVLRSAGDDPFTQVDLDFLSLFANHAAIAVENTRLVDGLQLELTERRQAEAQLRKLSRAVEQTGSTVVITDANGDIEYVNPKFTDSTGYSSEEVMGQNPRILKSGHTSPELYKQLWETIGSGGEWRGELLNKKKNGDLFWENATISPIQNERGETTHFIAVKEDITERKKAEVEIGRHLAELEALYENGLAVGQLLGLREIGERIILTFARHLSWHHVTIRLKHPENDDLELIAFNQPDMREDERAEVNRRFNSMISKVGQGLSGWVVQTGEALRTGDVRVHSQYVNTHAGIRSGLYMPLKIGERVIGVISVESEASDAFTVQDERLLATLATQAAVAFENARLYQSAQEELLERKRIETLLADERNQLAIHIKERTADLSRANANLARALRVKDEFLANMSHELRTPLNAILGLSESLEEQIAGPLNEKQLKYISTISESGHHLLSLINDILDLAKIEAGQITLDINKVDIRSVCQSSQRMIKQLSQKKRQDVSLQVDNDISLMWADERRLKQMIVNLLSNAVKFTPEEGRIGLEVHRDRDANTVLITVWDSGIGINENDLPRVFSPFVQLDSGLAREATGTGLGLALVTQMARLHGGRVDVESQPGKGSRFTIVLPWEPALAAEAVANLRSTGRLKLQKTDGRKKRTILLIEDTPDVIMMIRDYLEAAEYQVTTAQDGLEGVDQAILTLPDLILMDIQMPRMDGFEATSRLRNDPRFKSTPIIALTALAMPNDRERCLAAGMDEYISKPVNLKALLKIIESFFPYYAESNPNE